MSRQKGIIKLVGNIGGISFYTSNGEYLARTAGGPTKEQIATGSNFRRTRENNKEFGGAAKAGKALRMGLSSVLQNMADSLLTSRLTSLFKMINNKSVGIRGRRPIALSQNKELLRGFELNGKNSFSTVFNAPFTISANADRNEITVTVPDFIPVNYINAPAGATGYRLLLACGLVSDYSYDQGTQGYEPDVPDQNGLGVVAASDISPLDNVSVDFDLTATFEVEEAFGSGVSVVACLGIEFYQRVDAADYLFAQGSTMQVTEVF